MPQPCVSLRDNLQLQQLQAENDELRQYLAAQKQVIASLERRVGRSLDAIGVHVQQLTGALQAGSEPHSSVNTVQHEVSSLCDLLADAMLLQKLEAGKVEVEIEPLSLSAMLSTVSRHLLNDDSSTRLICEFAPILPIVQADQELLEAVLIDLLARGLRYSDDNSPVILGARQEGTQAHLYVTAQRFAPAGNRDFATEIVLCCRRIEVQHGTVTCYQCADGWQSVILTLELAS